MGNDKLDHDVPSFKAPVTSRRSFLKWSAIAAGAVALSSNAGCGLQKTESTEAASQAGEWIPAQCWADCGSRGFNKVYVEDGKAVRMGTDEREDKFDCPQVRSCARGRAQRKHLFGADRIKYPMKRKSWSPGGGANINGDLRGKDDWVRISWEEALDYVADEMKRIIETYGNEAILIPGYVSSLFGQWDVGRMMCLNGGYMDNWGACSSGAWGSIAPYIGLEENYNDKYDLFNSDLIVLWGSNPAWSRAGLPTYNYMEMKKAGVKFILIDVWRNPTGQALADDWIPVRPGTDTALALGMAYVILKADEAEGGKVIDWDLLNRCTLGFDAEHMPEGADTTENFKDYVLGTYDGTPKTPEWASERCGVPVDIIEALALEIAKTEKVAICMAPSIARATNGDTWPQTILALGAMSGCIGKSGCMVGSDKGHSWQVGGPPLIIGGSVLGDTSWFTPGGLEMLENPIGGISPSRFTGAPDGMYTRPKAPFVRINNNELWTSVLNGTFIAGKDDVRECKTKMFYHTHSNFINQAPGTMLAIEAHRKLEFVVTQNLVMTSTAQYSDIVLPVTSQWERSGDVTMGYREQIVYTRQVTEPLFEAKNDIWIAEELAKRMDVSVEELSPITREQELYDQLAASIAVKEDGTTEPLLTITADDIKELQAEGEPQEGRIPYQQLKEEGMYQVERSKDDPFGFICFEKFREDPEANKLNTVTGKLEIYSQTLADDLNACGFNTVGPLAKYRADAEGYEETFANWETKEKGEFPFQLVSLHSVRFAHSTFGNVPVLREAIDHPLYMNPLDGANLGLTSGETVLITSKWGKSLRPVLLTDMFMPGVLGLAQGAWVEIDEATGVDLAGSVNVLIGPNARGFGHQSYNSCIVKVEKWTGEALTPDAEWEQRVPVKEA